jgi:restriction endonuclease
VQHRPKTKNVGTLPPLSSLNFLAIRDITDAGVSADRQISTRVRDVAQVKFLPDILAFLQKETELTRHTLAEILKRSGRLGEFKINPQAFMVGAASQISRALHDLMLEGIKYEKVAGQHWEMSRIEQDAEDGIREKRPNHIPLRLISSSKQSNFENRSEQVKS